MGHYSETESDRKFHEPHWQQPWLQRLDNAMWSLRRIRVPLPAVLVSLLLSGWAGSYLSVAPQLPTPQGPKVVERDTESGYSPRGSLRRALMVLPVREAESLTGHLPASPTSMTTDQSIQMFESRSLNSSGFLTARPPLPVPVSGEVFMRAIPFQVISLYPRITYYPGFLDAAQAEHLVALASKYMYPSGLAYKPGESIPESQQVRTSTGCFLNAGADPDGVLAAVEAKIAAVTHLPRSHGEAFNVLRYKLGQHYDSHMDTFDPKDFNVTSQRIATFLIYLRSPEEGGETVFKREGRDGADKAVADWRTCSDGMGIKVKPRQGDAVLFWSATPSLELDPRALHGACPVIKGEKWSMASCCTASQEDLCY
ncbi:Fe2OG dioxygenase domain-containing protein, partial [Haematococcus lacustris]